MKKRNLAVGLSIPAHDITGLPGFQVQPYPVRLQGFAARFTGTLRYCNNQPGSTLLMQVENFHGIQNLPVFII
ncbi:MAG: hypothetical protein KIT80_01570 [Chitinophagaceae bacterium]|nr:hypothetical protein [Chitinophagaceae bacterium]MCW5925575.1 hypothetical protein [Chitinophagaceae bacterium]